MDDEQLESSRSLILSRLRSEGGRPQLGALPKFVVSAEAVVLSCLSKRAAEIVSVRSTCDLVSGQQLVNRRTRERFIWTVTEGGRYHTECRFDVIPLDIDGTAYKPVRRSALVNSPGRFKRLVVSLPTSLASAATPVLENGQVILDTGYSWVADQVLALTDALEMHVADGLYSLAREIFPETIYRSELWFATVGPLYGFRLIAPEVVDGALKIYTEGSRNLPVSPLDLLAQLLASCLPRDLLLMDIAVRRQGAMDVDVSNAGYAKDPYAFVMTGLYKSTSFTIFPFLTRNDVSIMALFPTGRPIILSRLQAHEQEFQDRARVLASAIREASSLFTVKDNSDQLLGELDVGNQNVAHLLGQAVDAVRSESGRSGIPIHARLRFIKKAIG